MPNIIANLGDCLRPAVDTTRMTTTTMIVNSLNFFLFACKAPSICRPAIHHVDFMQRGPPPEKVIDPCSKGPIRISSHQRRRFSIPTSSLTLLCSHLSSHCHRTFRQPFTTEAFAESNWPDRHQYFLCYKDWEETATRPLCNFRKKMQD